MRILLFGDTLGIHQLLQKVPNDVIIGIVAASIRPHYLKELKLLAARIKKPFLIQPKWKSVDYKNFHSRIVSLKPDLLLTYSYSMIIREDVLSAIRLGGLNIHTALLPRNRGCNPIQWAILNNDYNTGVTLHQLDSSLDTGPIIDQLKVPIFFEDTWLDVRKRLNKATEELLSNNISNILNNNWETLPQCDDKVIFGKRRYPEDGMFNWSETVINIHNKIRALVPPLPPAHYYTHDGKKIEITKYHTPWQLTLKKYSSELMKRGAVMQSELICLRPLQKKDSSLLYEWINDRELIIHNAPYFPISESDHEAWVERMMKKQSDLVIFVIEEPETKKAIGTCQLLNINWNHQSAELQIRIGNSDNHNKGYGTEALKQLCNFGFEDLNLYRIYLHVFSDNSRAIRSYEKSGFMQEGILRKAVFINGNRKDVLVMSKMRIDE